MDRLEYDLWKILSVAPRRYGRIEVTDSHVARLKALSAKCGGWIVFDDEHAETFVAVAAEARVAQFLPVRGERQTCSAKEAARPPLAAITILACLLSSSCATIPASKNEPEPPVVAATPDKAPALAARVDSGTDGPSERRRKTVRRPGKDNVGPRTAISKIDPTLLAEGPATADGVFQHVAISLKKTPPTREEAELIRALDGRAARFDNERTRIHGLVLAHRRTRIRAVQEPVREFIESIGGTVFLEGRAAFGLDASLTRTMVLHVAELPEVDRLDADHPLVESAHPR